MKLYYVLELQNTDFQLKVEGENTAIHLAKTRSCLLSSKERPEPRQ